MQGAAEGILPPAGKTSSWALGLVVIRQQMWRQIDLATRLGMRPTAQRQALQTTAVLEASQAASKAHIIPAAAQQGCKAELYNMRHRQYTSTHLPSLIRSCTAALGSWAEAAAASEDSAQAARISVPACCRQCRCCRLPYTVHPAMHQAAGCSLQSSPPLVPFAAWLT